MFLARVAVTDNAASIESRLAELSNTRVDALAAERDEYRKLYLQRLELCRKLELGIVGAQRERLPPGDGQLTMSLLGMLLGDGAEGTPAEPAPPPAPAQTEVEAHTRAKPTGRKPLPEKLPRVEIELLPPEVQVATASATVLAERIRTIRVLETLDQELRHARYGSSILEA